MIVVGLDRWWGNKGELDLLLYKYFPARLSNGAVHVVCENNCLVPTAVQPPDSLSGILLHSGGHVFV